MKSIIHKWHDGGEPLTYEYRFPMEKENAPELSDLFKLLECEVITEDLIENHRRKKTDRLKYNLSKSVAELLTPYSAKAIVQFAGQWGVKLERKNGGDHQGGIIDRQLFPSEIEVDLSNESALEFMNNFSGLDYLPVCCISSSQKPELPNQRRAIRR